MCFKTNYINNFLYILAELFIIFLSTTVINANEINFFIENNNNNQKLQTFEEEEYDSIYFIIKEIQDVRNFNLNAIFALDVFSYYNLKEKYDTDLKKEYFKKTDDYKEKLEELKLLRANISNMLFYLKLYSISDYDIKKGGFYIGDEIFCCLTFLKSGENICFENKSSYEEFMFSSLPIEIQSLEDSNSFAYKFAISLASALSGELIKYLGPILLDIKDDVCSKKLIKLFNSDKVKFKFYKKYIFLNIDEETALEIENNKYDIDVYLVFNVVDKILTSKTIKAIGCSYNLEYFKTANTRLIILNKKEKKIYIDEVYK